MTDREKAIVMAYTGICMLEGEKIGVFYQYLDELYDRPVYTHEWVTLDIKEKSKPDFLQLCKEEEPEHKKGKWKSDKKITPTYDALFEIEDGYFCSECGKFARTISNYCPYCGADMRGKEE